ncbi:MAG: TlpA disulfide reductase family protein [Planctomycetota bacterium]|nr:TlpA disulfide reductase family protein [Planctomycetota bacterium]
MKSTGSPLRRSGWLCMLSLTLLLAVVELALAQGPTVDQAMKIRPRQPGIQCDTPGPSELAACRIEKSSKRFQVPGYVVYDGTGRILRQFFDTNSDGSLDQWSYFKDGVEVYRDIDSNYDKRADQYRWLGTAGTRWGLDRDQDGAIDRWKMISAEEAAEEVFKAVQNRDVDRFALLLPSQEEVDDLNLGPVMQKVFEANVKNLASKFKQACEEQNQVNAESRWVHFGSSRPSLVPRGQSGIEQDVVVYDHASAVFQTGEQYGQLSIGTIVRIDDTWRITEIPQVLGKEALVRNGGLFYPSDNSSTLLSAASEPTDNQMMSRLFGQFDQLEKSLGEATSMTEIKRLEKERASVLLELALNSDGEDRANWIRQMADTLSGSYQAERFDDGLEVLAESVKQLKSEGVELEEDYPRWRMINAKFSKAIADGNSEERDAANDVYMEELEAFVGEFPQSDFSAEAMLQLALYSEVSGEDDSGQAVEWYEKIQQKFGDTLAGKRAAGAITRLSAQGKPIDFRGRDVRGRVFDLKAARGKIVVIHYWETWCGACIDGFEELERLRSKYGSKLLVVGANLDSDKEKLRQFLTNNRSLTWTQLNAPGGVEQSPLAIQMGVTTLPMNLLIDARGNLVESNVPVEELDREIQRLIKQAGVAAGPKQKIRN